MIDTGYYTSEALTLLHSLIGIPSISREEEAAADFLQNYIEETGIMTGRSGNNIWCISPMFDIRKLLYLIILTVQTGNQADGPGTVDSTALHQRVSMRKGLFVVHQSSIGRFRAGCQPQKENQQEKKGGMFHLEILCL